MWGGRGAAAGFWGGGRTSQRCLQGGGGVQVWCASSLVCACVIVIVRESVTVRVRECACVLCVYVCVIVIV